MRGVQPPDARRILQLARFIRVFHEPAAADLGGMQEEAEGELQQQRAGEELLVLRWRLAAAAPWRLPARLLGALWGVSFGRLNETRTIRMGRMPDSTCRPKAIATAVGRAFLFTSGQRAQRNRNYTHLFFAAGSTMGSKGLSLH